VLRGNDEVIQSTVNNPSGIHRTRSRLINRAEGDDNSRPARLARASRGISI
jgi:hypothetical protein